MGAGGAPRGRVLGAVGSGALPEGLGYLWMVSSECRSYGVLKVPWYFVEDQRTRWVLSKTSFVCKQFLELEKLQGAKFRLKKLRFRFSRS